MVTTFVQGLWRGMRPEDRGSVRRGPSGRRRQAPRVIESLEDRVLLNADVEQPDRPYAIVAYIAIPPPPPPDFAEGETARGGEGDVQGPPPLFPISEETATWGEASTPDEDSVEEGPTGPPAPPVTAASRSWGPTVWAGRSGPAATSTMTVHDDVGNEMSSWGPPVGAAASWPLPIVAPESFEYGPMPGVIPPSLAELAQVPRISWAADQSVSGSMDGQNPSTLVRIPVGPSTQKLTLGLKPDQDGLGFHPRIDQVFLLGRSGEVITSILGVSFLGEGFEQTLYLAIHGAPIGGEVVVRMVATRLLQPLEADAEVAPSLDGATDEEGGGGGDNRLGASPLPWGGGDFELNVKRSDPEAPSFLKSEPFAPGAGSIGVVATERGEVVTGIGSLTPAPDRIVTPTESGPGARVAVPTAATRTDVDLELADEGPVEVYLGPLVSRTAAALGPALATTADEPTTSTDRGRPGPGGLEAFGADMDLEMILAIRARSEGGDADASADPDPALTTLRGPGGVPIVVAGLRSGDRDTDSDDLAASVVGSGDDDATMLAEALDATSPLDGSGPEVARAGLTTRAVGFLIGMGLASGPLYPDLVALARKKLRLKPRRAGKRRSRPA